MGKNWIVPGMEVAHIDNPDKRLRAEEIVRRDKRNEDGSIFSIVIGVRCTWFDELPGGKKIACRMIYHTKTLVPWEVALNGPTGIQDFLG